MSFSICHDPSSYTMPGSHRLTPSQDIGGWSNHLRSTWARQILWHHLPGGLHRTLGDEAWKHLVKTMELPESNWIQLNPLQFWSFINFLGSLLFDVGISLKVKLVHDATSPGGVLVPRIQRHEGLQLALARLQCWQWICKIDSLPDSLPDSVDA